MDKNFKIEYTPDACADVESIADYIATTLCAPQAAKKLLFNVRRTIETLQRFPFSGTLLAEQMERESQRRWLRVGNYMIFYVVDEQKETVYILRVLYGPSDYLEIL
ncbi:MAG: type II toxin-antitoxin system RelE/ParE family toxin [Clostridia bacterium]|nr:type II toxin-antitoxin system RelE/ParE family toxin [Clostridia bacterium]